MLTVKLKSTSIIYSYSGYTIVCQQVIHGSGTQDMAPGYSSRVWYRGNLTVTRFVSLPFPFPVPALASVHVLSSPFSISLEDFRLSRLSGSWSWIILFLLLFLFLLFFAFSFLVCPSMPQYVLGSDLPRVSPALCQTSNQSLEPQPATMHCGTSSR